MPRRQTAPIGAPCWVELTTSDAERSRAFYTQLFGWTAEEPNQDFGGYFNFVKDEVRIAGCMAGQPGSGMTDNWSVYLASDDTARTVQAAAAYGGVVHVPAMPVGDLGTMAFVGDAGGAAIGVWQPGAFQGFGALGDPGTPSWFELYTRDYQTAIDFYRQVFRWQTHVVSDTPEFRYTILKHGEDWLAGIMDGSTWLPAGVPAHWATYFGVEDTEAVLTTIVQLGGKVLRAAEDTPYGRLATAADPTGAQFKLVAPNAAMPARTSAKNGD